MEEVNIEKIKHRLCQFCNRCHKDDEDWGCESLKEILEYLASQGFCIIAKDQTLPEIPGFQYDKEEYRPYLIRGAINYSKLLSGFKWVMPLQNLMEGKEK